MDRLKAAEGWTPEPDPRMDDTSHAPKGAQGPNCWQCQHFAMSYVPQMPYACRLMGFQSRALPAQEVLRADGRFCRGFTAKAVPAQPAQAQLQGLHI
jgi:hypothetical protein